MLSNGSPKNGGMRLSTSVFRQNTCDKGGKRRHVNVNLADFASKL
jgi:hypothetical protein